MLEVALPSLVSARGVQKRYGSIAVLKSVDFEIERGITGLLGPNGSGKTTLLGMILGLHRVDGGTLEVLGIDPWQAGHEIRALLGYAPEHHVLPPDLKATDFVRHVAELHGLPRAAATVRASDALWLVGLGEERFRPMGTMSTGQRQRVKLAQAIAHDPQLVLLDEPTDGLDPLQRDVMLDLIRSVSSEYGIDIVLSSHLLDEVERVCDGAVIIGDGHTIASGSLDQLGSGVEERTRVKLDATDDEVERVAIALRENFEVFTEQRWLTIEGVPSEVSASVVALCDELSIGVVEYGATRQSLEDVYLGESG